MNKIDENKIFQNITNKNNINFIKYIIDTIHKNINEYNLSLIDFYKKYMKITKFENMFLFIIYKDGKIYTVFEEGDKRKKIIINIVKKIIKKLEKIYGKLFNMFIPFYVSDTHFYHDNSIPFFVEAKPKNKKGILYPDKDFYSIKLKERFIDYDELKKILKNNNCENINNKKSIIYFSGANTGSDKHNIRKKLKEIVENNNNKKYNIHISEQYVPLYNFCKYKYLLNLPGHQPWSYRMSKILLMNSLVIDISILQKYIYKNKNKIIEDNNEKWIQIYSEYFEPNKDYIEIKYDWTEKITTNLQVNNIYNEINKIYKFYENNLNDYIKISKNGTKKANQLNMKIINKTWEYLIIYFNKKIYENNSQDIINNFIDKLLKIKYLNK
jgi:hypothetical protein